jgi:N-acetylmuramoyl-L-alanine amidase
MMRDSDRFVELDDRVSFANRYPGAVLVSIHFNDSASSCAGPETYWWRVDSYTLAKRVQQNLSAVTDQHNSRDQVRRRLRLTRNPMIPCILVECGYISNSREAKQISNTSYRNQLAHAVASAIRQQAAAGDGNLGPLPPFIKAPPSRHSDARGS